MICERDERPQMAPSTAIWLSLDGFREVRLILPDDLSDEEMGRVIAAVRRHVTEKRLDLTESS